MGLFSFIKEAGEKLFGGKEVEAAVTQAAGNPAAKPSLDALNQQAALGKRIHRPGFIAEATDDTEHAVTVDHAMHGGGRRGKIDGD